MNTFKLFFILAALSFSIQNYGQVANSQIAGVWANKDCELLLTEKTLLLFERNNNAVTATFIHFEPISKDKIMCNVWGEIRFGEKGIDKKHIRTNLDSTVILSDLAKLSEKTLQVTINGNPQMLVLIEKIKSTPPYDMPAADKFSIGDRLQEWRIGTTFSYTPTSISFEAGTNKHDYCFYVQDGFYYCRAARIRSNNMGTLFAQNIRLMSKVNEYTVSMPLNNFKISNAELLINNSKFTPNQCVFDKDGIYWSFIEFTPDKIFLNGCGETYAWEKSKKNSSTKDEWFEFAKY